MNNIESILVNNYKVKIKNYEGRKHMVVPVVMMVEGVHSGSKGAIYHSEEELSKNIQSWNGIPVTIGHPKNDKGYISANSPEVVSVGKIFNTCYSGKLKAEAWIDIEKIGAQSMEALEYIKQGKALDVSVGVFSDDIEVNGRWGVDEESYVAKATNYRPDHLALLPGESGACSWNDGCGIRVNRRINVYGGKGSGSWEGPGNPRFAYEGGEEEGEDTFDNKLEKMKKDRDSLIKLARSLSKSEDSKLGRLHEKIEKFENIKKEYERLKNLNRSLSKSEDTKMWNLYDKLDKFQTNQEDPGIVNKLQTNKKNYTEIINDINNKLKEQNTENPYIYHYCIEVYDDEVIYEKSEARKTQYYKQPYSYKNGEVEFVGNPIEVEKQISYVPIIQSNCTKCEEKIVILVNSEKTNFTEGDREWLSTFTEEQLIKLFPKTPTRSEIFMKNRKN